MFSKEKEKEKNQRQSEFPYLIFSSAFLILRIQDRLALQDEQLLCCANIYIVRFLPLDELVSRVSIVNAHGPGGWLG